jgi:preprotein translocase subunit SecG
VVGYGPFSLCMFHKEGPSLSSEYINRLMMMMITLFIMIYLTFANIRSYVAILNGKEMFLFLFKF